MTKILSVATAAIKADQLADRHHQRFPRMDYLELQHLTGAETLDYTSYENKPVGNILRKLETQLRSDIYLASLSWLRGYQFPLTFSWSERAGIPLAAYKKFFRTKAHFVTMFQCWSRRQELVMTKLGLFSAMDVIIVHCSSMLQNFIDLGVPEEKIKVIHYSIDQFFYAPIPEIDPEKGMIISLGETRSRDYNSLFMAVEDLPVKLLVPAYGHWYAREKSKTMKRTAIPANVSLINHMSQVDLRNLYARSQFVVLPIYDLVYSAGATATLEAGSMARAVIAYRSRGITDYIIDGETGILVEPGNIEAMKNAIQFLLSNPAEAKRMGDNARQRIVGEFNLESYVGNIANILLRYD